MRHPKQKHYNRVSRKTKRNLALGNFWVSFLKFNSENKGYTLIFLLLYKFILIYIYKKLFNLTITNLINNLAKKFFIINFILFSEKSRSTRRGLLLSLVLYTAAVFQGQVVIQVYAEPLFSEVVPNVSATVASVLFAVVNIIAAIFVVYLVDRMGRRVCL